MTGKKKKDLVTSKVVPGHAAFKAPQSLFSLCLDTPAAHTVEVTAVSNLHNCLNNPYFSKRGEPGSV